MSEGHAEQIMKSDTKHSMMKELTVVDKATAVAPKIFTTPNKRSSFDCLNKTESDAVSYPASYRSFPPGFYHLLPILTIARFQLLVQRQQGAERTSGCFNSGTTKNEWFNSASPWVGPLAGETHAAALLTCAYISRERFAVWSVLITFSSVWF